MDIKIVVDSAADILEMENSNFAAVPLKIVTSDKEFVDDKEVDVEELTNYLATYKGKTTTSCPSAGDWLEAFGGAERVICVTITGTLSGSYNAATLAKNMYEEKHSDRKVFVIDSLSAGPEMKLIVEKIQELIDKGEEFEEICQQAVKYKGKTSLLFTLQSLTNLANNGRVKPAVAKIAGILGIRIVGKASDVGDLEPLDKVRGEAKVLSTIINRMKNMGYQGGKVRISHCFNIEIAEKLKKLIEDIGGKDILISPTRALCSFYAEKGGCLIAFER